LVGLAAIHPSLSSAAAISHPTPKTPSTFYINKPSINNADVASRQPQVVPRASAVHKLIFDTSDSRRALDDWELEDYVLVATIEGNLYALDRYSGATKWVLEGKEPAVRSVGNKYFSDTVNTTQEPRNGMEEQQPRWIVQPVEGGQLFLFDPEFGVLVRTQV
jgi:serine/threonine-protein kinase/endoribonuclease IRE1